MQNVEIASPRVSENLERAEEVWSGDHSELLDGKTTALGLVLDRLLIYTLLTNAGYDRIESKFDLLCY